MDTSWNEITRTMLDFGLTYWVKFNQTRCTLKQFDSVPWTCMIIPHVSFVLSCLTWSFMPLHSEIYQGAIQRSAETVGWKRLEISHHFSITPSRPLHYILVQLCGSDHQKNRWHCNSNREHIMAPRLQTGWLHTAQRLPIYFAAAFSIHFVPRCMCLASFLCAAHVHAETILWSRGVHKCL